MRGVVADRTFPESGTCARSHILSGSKVVRPAAKSARASSAKAFSTSWDWANLRVHPSSDTSSDCSHPAIRPRDVRMRPTTDRRRRGQMIVRFHVLPKPSYRDFILVERKGAYRHIVLGRFVHSALPSDWAAIGAGTAGLTASAHGECARRDRQTRVATFALAFRAVISKPRASSSQQERTRIFATLRLNAHLRLHFKYKTRETVCTRSATRG
jgi:hypothetical protein